MAVTIEDIAGTEGGGRSSAPSPNKTPGTNPNPYTKRASSAGGNETCQIKTATHAAMNPIVATGLIAVGLSS
jgi:hypothetical protein